MNRRSFLQSVIGASCVGLAGERETSPSIRRLHPAFDRIVPVDTALERIVDGHQWLEGPAWHRQSRSLYFSDIPRNTVYRWRENNGVLVALHPSGYTGTHPFQGPEPGSNGLAFDSLGRLTLCEHGDRRLSRLEPDGRRTILADRFQGKRLNSPNDLVYSSNGDLYFTDPPFGLPGTFNDPARELPFCGVYRLDRWGGLSLVTSEVSAPNGIALSPDEKTLYVTNADRKQAVWMAYKLDSNGQPAKSRVFFDATEWARDERRKGAPDGMKTDRHGNLFGAGPGGLYIFSPAGTLLGRFEFGFSVSNCAWGDAGSTLYMTASSAIYRVRLLTGI